MGQEMKEKQEREAARKALKQVPMKVEIEISEAQLEALSEATGEGLKEFDEGPADKIRDTLDVIAEGVRQAVAERDAD